MTTMNMIRRVKALEGVAHGLPALGFTCIPLEKVKSYHQEVSPGVYRDTCAGGIYRKSLYYTDRELLDQYLALPEQASQRHTIYHVLSVEECAAIRAEVESRI